MNNLALVAAGFNVAPLLQAVNSRSDLWNQITARQSYEGSAHKDTQCIFLRWSEILSADAAFNAIHAVDYPAIFELPESLYLVNDIMELVDGEELGRVLITSLKPGGQIAPHIDEGKYSDYYQRFHLPLQADDGNWFFVGKPGDKDKFEAVQMEPGTLWNFNHKETHWVANNSDRPRIHLIVDCVAPKYREANAISA